MPKRTTIRRSTQQGGELDIDARPPVIGMLSTYPPTQCGLATFSAALVRHLRELASVGVVRVVDDPELSIHQDVLAHLVNGSPDSAAAAARRLNDLDAVIIQHEYGIYGGPDGIDVLHVVDALTVPTIIVLHTVLQAPTPGQRYILSRLVNAADVVVTLTETAKRRLITTYSADPVRIVVIPHGAPDHGPVPSVEQRPFTRPLVLTWGLIGPGKGIEWAIDAMAGLADLRPRYLVLGRTHPKVAHRDGEAYRDGLGDRARDAGVADLVEFDDRYLDTDALGALVRRAAAVLLPYDSREQVTSGVLVEAVAAGRPVVSTAFPHAVELLGDGTGLVVAQRDPAALGSALRRVLSEPGLADAMAARAAGKAPDLLWSAVADRYRRIATRAVAASLAEAS